MLVGDIAKELMVTTGVVKDAVNWSLDNQAHIIVSGLLDRPLEQTMKLRDEYTTTVNIRAKLCNGIGLDIIEECTAFGIVRAYVDMLEKGEEDGL